jgi:uncharacterized membrane protein YfcA
MLGVGGAVVLLPLLTAFAGLTLKEATNITVVQVVASSLIGWWAFRRGGLVHTRLAVWMGGAGAVGGFAGGYASGRLSELQLQIIFLSVVVAALVLLFLPVREIAIAGVAQDGKNGMPSFNVPFAVGLGGLVGALAGMLGAGGGFLIVPLMLTALRIPMRLAIGSSSVVKLISSSFGYAGKLAGTHIDPVLASTLLVSAIPSTYVGTWIARRVPPRYLRYTLAGMLIINSARSVQTLFFTP